MLFFLQPIHLKAEKYLLKGLVNVESSPTEIESELAENIIVDMQDMEGSVINSISAKLASDGHGVYEYYTWANLGEKIIFVPRDSRYGSLCFQGICELDLHMFGEKFLFHITQPKECLGA